MDCAYLPLPRYLFPWSEWRRRLLGWNSFSNHRFVAYSQTIGYRMHDLPFLCLADYIKIFETTPSCRWKPVFMNYDIDLGNYTILSKIILETYRIEYFRVEYIQCQNNLRTFVFTCDCIQLYYFHAYLLGLSIIALVILCCIWHGRYICNQKERPQIRQGRYYVAVCECQIVHSNAFSICFWPTSRNTQRQFERFSESLS